MKQRITDYQLQIKALKREDDAEKLQIKENNQNLTAELIALTTELNKLKNEKEDIYEENSVLVAEIERLNAVLQNQISEITKYKATIDDCNNLLKTTNDEIKSKDKQIETLLKEKEFALTDKTQSEHELVQLRHKLINFSTLKQDMTKLEELLRKEQFATESKENELNLYKEKLLFSSTFHSEQLAALKETIEMLRNEKDKLKDEYKQEKAAYLQESESSTASLNAEINRLRVLINNINSENAEKIAQLVANHKKEKEDWQIQMFEIKEHKGESKSESMRDESRLLNFFADQKGASNSIANRISKEMEETEYELQVKQLKKENENLLKQNTKYYEEIVKLGEANEELEDKLSVLEEKSGEYLLQLRKFVEEAKGGNLKRN